MATIGVFDGVHRGHRALLEVVLERARTLGLPSLAITFDPHPVAVLSPRAGRHLLTPPAGKLRLLAELGLDSVLVLRFSRWLAALDPVAFLRDFLLRRIRLEEFWVGYDYRFGRDRGGEFNLLRSEGEALGFRVQQFGPVHQGGQVLSSTRVREALRAGRLEEALDVLGHSFLLEGRVGRGRGDAARLLVPTANLVLAEEQCLPAYGVYAAWAEVAGELRPGVANIGLRPTLTRDESPTVEVHLIEWQGDIRDRPIALHLRSRLREERRFDSVDLLRAAIEDDIRRARSLLAGDRPRIVAAPESYGGRAKYPLD